MKILIETRKCFTYQKFFADLHKMYPTVSWVESGSYFALLVETVATHRIIYLLLQISGTTHTFNPTGV
jgi:hypothetical protein